MNLHGVDELKPFHQEEIPCESWFGLDWIDLVHPAAQP